MKLSFRLLVASARSRNMVDSTVLYPGIRNKHCAVGFARQVLWALARAMGRVKAVFLQLDIEASTFLLNPLAHGSYREPVEVGIPLCMNYESVDSAECYVVDMGSDTVYIAENALTIETWKEDVGDLGDGQDGIRRSWRSWRTLSCQRDLMQHIYG